MTINLSFLVWMVVFAIIFFAPFALIWALNVLFNLGLDYTLDTWAAALIISSVLSGRGTSIARKSDK